MRKLPQKLRLCVNLMSSSFKIIVLHSETHSQLRRDIAQRQPCAFVLLAARLGGCCRVECFSLKYMPFRRCSAGCFKTCDESHPLLLGHSRPRPSTPFYPFPATI